MKITCTVLHNPKCRKSREVLDWMRLKNIEFNTVLYLNEPMSFDYFKSIIEKLNLEPIELIRKNESDYIEHVKNKNLDNESLLRTMLKHPKLIQRPIVISGRRAVLARPFENLISFFDNDIHST